jgi:hypothetical protein
VFSHTPVVPDAPGAGGLGESANQFSVPQVERNGTLDIGYALEECNTSLDHGFRFQKSTNGGASFLSAPVHVDKPGQFVDNPDPGDLLPPTVFRAPNTLSIDYSSKTGTLTCLYQNYVNGAVSGADISVQQSRDGGFTWTDARFLSVQAGGAPARNDQFFPWVDSSPDGNLYAIWFDRRRDPANRNIHTWQATSTNDGRGWQQRRISTRSWNPDLGFFTSGAFIGDYNGIAASNRAVYPGLDRRPQQRHRADRHRRDRHLHQRRAPLRRPPAGRLLRGGRPARAAPGTGRLTAASKQRGRTLSHQGGDTMLSTRLGPAGSLRQDWRRRPWAALLPALALVVAGCAQRGTGTPRSGPATASSSPNTVMVGPDDGGRTVNLEVGDRLVVRLQTAGRPSRFLPPWMLRLPPSRVLERVPGDPDAARVVLVAAEGGTVRLLLVKRAGCTPPLRCPVAAAGPTGQRERMRPPLAGVTVVITVRVR